MITTSSATQLKAYLLHSDAINQRITKKQQSVESFSNGGAHHEQEKQSGLDLSSTTNSIVAILPILLYAIFTGSLYCSPTIAFAEVSNMAIIPVAATAIYVGFISGYIPSPLYARNERWPRWYAIMQLLFLALTASRLTPQGKQFEDETLEEVGNEEDEYSHDIKELAEFTHWLGSNLYNLFYKEGGFEKFIEKIGEVFTFLFVSVMFSHILVHNSKFCWKMNEAKELPMVLIFIRNLFLFFLINIWFTWEDMNDPDSDGYKYCEKEHNVTPGWIAPDYPFTQLVTEFAAGWKMFHLSSLWMVRMSHAILYPSILLLLTRRRLTMFLVWIVFIEIDFFHMFADMFHYVSGPELAEERLDFQGTAKDCFVNVHLWQNILAYPLNFLYLTTSMGDTS